MDIKSLEYAVSLGWSNVHNPLTALLLIPFAGLLLNVMTQIFVLRLSGGRDFMRSIAVAFLIGAVSSLALHLFAAFRWCGSFQPSPTLWEVLLEWCAIVAPTYAGLGYGYANFANLGNSSIRIRLYEELRLTPNGRCIEEIREQYDDRAILKIRMHRLTQWGDLIRVGNRLKVARSRFVEIGGVVFFIKRLVLQKRSEFDSVK